MNRSQAGLDDLVSVWLNAHDIQAPALRNKKIFEFSPAYLAVSSNSEPFIKKISDRLHAYLCRPEEIDLDGKTIIEAEIVTFADSIKKKGIDLPPFWNQISLDLVSPEGFQVFKLPAGKHAFRPFDSRRFLVADCGHLHVRLSQETPCVHGADIAQADDSDFYFIRVRFWHCLFSQDSTDVLELIISKILGGL